MHGQVKKWGNSLAIRLPKAIADQANLSEGTDVLISFHDNTITLKRAPKPYTLDELLEGITPENIHAEVQIGSLI